MPRKLKINLILSTAAILLPVLAGLILWNRLPDSVPIHWNAAGDVDGYGSRLFVVLGLPGLMLLFHIVTVFSILSSSKKDQYGTGGVAIIMWLIPMISAFTAFLLYSGALGLSIEHKVLVPIIICIVFFFCGIILWRYPGMKLINFPTKCLATRSFSGLVMMICSAVGLVLSIFGLHIFLIAPGALCIIAPIIYHFTKGRYIG